jgi:voltage-gated potassium channel
MDGRDGMAKRSAEPVGGTPSRCVVRQEGCVMARFHPVEHQFETFMRKPLSVRKAMTVIVTATIASVVIGGVVINLVDSEEFPGIGTGLWWALQTVTTVGYGDVAPRDTVGRLVGAVIMLESIAFISIVTAAITSSFVERARREHAASSTASGSADHEELLARLAEISARLDRIQQELEIDGSSGGRRG